MTAAWLILAAAASLCASGLPGYAAGARAVAAQRLSAAAMIAASALGIAGVVAAFAGPTPAELHLPWQLPWGEFAVRIDAIAALFLLPVLVVPALGAIFAIGYWPAGDQPQSARRLALVYGVLAGSMVLVVAAADGVLFLVAWEVMALAAYFASTVDEDDPAVRRAGWVYLVATHAGTLCLIAMFALWHHATGSFALEPAGPIPAGIASAIFVLAVVGFGFKAGLMPFHVWLPGAHANAPSHVSAVMSGVMLKMGIYGIVRISGLLATAPPWWGAALLATGAMTGLFGIAFAIAQQDLKRLLAYSSIENVGIIAVGLGLALLGRSLGRPEWVILGFSGALLHVLNHALFKPLLFLGAGTVIHATRTRTIDRLGGLAKAMPMTGAAFLLGAVAICGLPPLNGFVGEWLIYLGLFRMVELGGNRGSALAAAAAATLAMIGALAVVCFVKLVGTLFLGSARTEDARGAHDPERSMSAPIAALGTACVALGLLPATAAPLLERSVLAWTRWPALGDHSLAALVPLGRVSSLGAGLVVLAALLAAALRTLPRSHAVGAAPTWDCGYARPTARMQYTGSSFGQTATGLVHFVLWPVIHRPVVRGPFPRAARFRTRILDTLLDRGIVPVLGAAARGLPRLRARMPGTTQWYVLYVLATMIVLLVWGSKGLAR